MSAIVGIYNFNKEPISTELVNGMMQSLQHFPADDIQTLQKENLFLGCHAQWITPESVGEQLPYYDYSGELAITADAIIDNRNDLFAILQVSEADRKRITDSELILLAYKKWGVESPKYIIGDFAFMIFDEKNKLIFGARDFSGSRTLYYFKNEEKFAFSTTIKPLLSLPFIQIRLNKEWIAEYLAIPDMFNTVDLFSTVYEKIEQLPPSHCLLVKDRKVKFTRFNAINFNEKMKLKSNKEYEEAFRDIFDKAVKARLRTHHNVGAQLSGGLDSGSVVSFAAKALLDENKKLHTFSYVPLDDFVDWTPRSRISDERPFIKSTVNYVGNITDHYLNFKDRSPVSDIDVWLESLEMPYKFFLNSYWMRGIYEQASYRNIRILLTGARGNHTISWGTALDYYTNLFKKLKFIRLNYELGHYIQKKRTGRKNVLLTIGKRAFPFMTKFRLNENDYHFPIYINSEFANRTEVFKKIKEYGVDNTGIDIPDTYEARKRQFDNLHIWGNGVSGTKLSLRYSIWNRDPTNDLNVVRFCLSVPDSQYIQNGVDRSLIRRATVGYLPENIRLNQQSRGLQSADTIQRIGVSWNQLIDEFQNLTTNKLMSEFLNIEVIKSAIDKVKGDPKPEYMFYPEFKILMRSLIIHRFITNFF